MARLPTPGSDDGSWGDILNEYLSQSHQTDGTLKPNVVTASQLAPSSVASASLAPNSVTSIAIADGAVLNSKLDAPTKASLAKADSAVQGADPRLTDSRPPTAHAASHAAAGSDPVTVAESQVTGLTAALAAKVPASLFDANTILAATTDNTPAALTVPASTLVGRAATGDIAALTPAVVRDQFDLARASDVRASQRVWLSNVSWPMVAAHRTGPGEFGESTLWAADECLAAGVRVLETDFQWTSDGEIILMHDTTVDRTTTGTGSVSSLTAAQMSALRVDVSAQLHASGYADQVVPTLAEMVARYRGRAILVPEQKAGSAADVPALAAQLRAAGGRDCLIVQSFTKSVAEAWAAQGFEAMFLSATDVADPVALRAAGVRWVGYQFIGTGTAGEISRITAAKAAGLRVATWIHSRVVEVEAALAAGSDMPMSDYPGYCVPGRVRGQMVSFADGRLPLGFIPRDGDYQVTGGYLADTGSGFEWNALIGELGPITDSSFAVNVTMKFADTASRWGSVYLAGPDDYAYKTASQLGYHVLLRTTGAIDIYRTNGIAATPLATVSTGALTAGVDYTLTVRVTPTQIIASRSGSASQAIANDATYRHARWWPYWARGGYTGNVVHLRSMEVTS